MQLDFGEAPTPEAAGRTLALVVSNDVGNHYGETLMVLPVAEVPHHRVDVPGGPVDLGRLRVADRSRLRKPPADLPPPVGEAGMGRVDAALRTILDGLW